MVLTMPYPSKEGYRLVSIALGTANETARDAAAVAQLDWVMDNYEVHTFASTEDNYSLGLWGGLDGHEVKASPERYWDAFVRKDSYKVQVVRQLPALLPLKMGDVVGAVHVTFEDGTEQSMPLKSKTEILELTVTEQLHAIIQDVGTWWEGKDPS